jgi:acyl-CoA thioester hydrolase
MDIINKLSDITVSRIRFSEVDSMNVVWHGNYLRLLEDGRESFGAKYGLGYRDVYSHGLMTPIVDMQLSYKRSILYGDSAEIYTEYIASRAAKIVFEYTIKRASDGLLALKAKSTQAFIDLEGNLQLTRPEFYEQWQRRFGVSIP